MTIYQHKGFKLKSAEEKLVQSMVATEQNKD